MVTAFGDMRSAVSGLRAGAADYLAKPVDVQAACMSIHRSVERRAAKIEREQLRVRTEELTSRGSLQCAPTRTFFRPFPTICEILSTSFASRRTG